MKRGFALLMVLAVLMSGCCDRRCGRGPCSRGKGPGKCACSEARSSETETSPALLEEPDFQRLGDEMVAHLATNGFAAAQEIARRMQEFSSEHGMPACRMIGDRLVAAGQADAAVAWYDEDVWLQCLVLEQLAVVLRGKIDALCAAGRLYSALDLIAEYNDAQLLPRTAHALAEHLISRLLREGRLGEASRAAAFVADAVPRRAGLAELEVLTEVMVAIRQEDRRQAMVLFREAAGKLSDVYLARAAGQMIRSVSGDADMVEDVGSFVLTQLAKRGPVVSAVAHFYVNAAVREKDFEAAMDRLELVYKSALPAGAKVRVVSQFSYEIIGTYDDTLLKRFAPISTGLVMRSAPSPYRNRLARAALDANFLIRDLDSAGQVFEMAFADEREDDPAKYQAIYDKLLAHVAIQDERHQDAITHIKNFMTWVGSVEEPQYDPATGTTVPNVMVLGLNAGRIGDLLMKLGDDEGARRAYSDAIGLYKAALKEIDEDTPLHARAVSELKALKRK